MSWRRPTHDEKLGAFLVLFFMLWVVVFAVLIFQSMTDPKKHYDEERKRHEALHQAQVEHTHTDPHP